jgi:hypothetical protein
LDTQPNDHCHRGADMLLRWLFQQPIWVFWMIMMITVIAAFDQ